MSAEESPGKLRIPNRADEPECKQTLEPEAYALPFSRTTYEVWSPFDAAGAAEKLTTLLETDSR